MQATAITKLRKAPGERWVTQLCAGVRPQKAAIDKYLNDPNNPPDPGSQISRYLITICDYAKVP